MFGLAVYTWHRRSEPGALPFTFSLLFGALWAGGAVLEYLSPDLGAKIIWIRFQAVWQLPGAIAVTCFLLEYTWPGRWLTRRNLILISIFPLLIVLLILTDPIHHLIWRDFEFTGAVTPLLAPVGWLSIAVGYSLVIVNLIIFAWLYKHSPQHRWFVVLMLFGMFTFRAVYLVDKTHAIQSNSPLDVLGIAFAYLIYTIALFRFQILNPVTLARQMAIDQMRDGMLVVDNQGRLASLNYAATVILGLSEEQACGRPLHEILPGCAQAQDGGLNEIEINLGSGLAARTYLLTNSSLKDWRGQEAGHLLLLHDVTEQRRSQVQILEQQRALATLRERERLARELHDSIGQVLGYVSMQAQAIRKRALQGDMPLVEAQLTRLAEVAQEAHADVRDSILSLNTAAGKDWSFPTVLRQYLDAYHQNYGIQAHLTLPDVFGDGWFEPEEEVQLLRVIQEAMNNARKYGQASCVHVSFAKKEDGIQVVIADDGRGFDPDHVMGGERGHYGLRFMRERADLLGGILKVESSTGRGTSVILEVKRN
jgi:signal transduction histidine kinase